MEFQVTEGWLNAFPGAAVGVLAMADVENPPQHPSLEAYVKAVEEELRVRWSGATRADLNGIPVLESYRSHYRRFNKTYHVQLQLESVALKGKPLRSNGALVTAMFVAELHNLLLTAGHDLDVVDGPLALEVSQEGEHFVGIGGRDQITQAGDMLIRDRSGIISDVIYGPDDRTRITGATRRAVFTAYAPAGIGSEAVAHHLEELAHVIRLVAPAASVLHQAVYQAPGA